jgi:hypothetical protein
MILVSLTVILFMVGVSLWLINYYVPMRRFGRGIINGLIFMTVILVILSMLNII